MEVSTVRSVIPKMDQPKWHIWRTLEWSRAWPRQKIISDAFRLTAFGAAIIQLLAFPHGPGYHASELTALVLAGGLYSLAKIAQPFKWQQLRASNVLLLAVDIMVTVLLVHFSGGIHSPFILYTLLPVLTAALLKDYVVTVLVSVTTATYVLAGNIYNPATNYSLTLQAVNDFLVYAIALGLVAVLPYAINLKVGHRLQSTAVEAERRRISRDLHDSVCQTLCGLRWQVQRLSERAALGDPLSDELKGIERSVNTAEQDARGLLEILCTLSNNGGFLPNIKRHLEQLRLYAGINYRLEADQTDVVLAEPVERELSMICIEALTNIKKHAEARNVLFRANLAGDRVQIEISDDGRGFDGTEPSTRIGHGLSIMRERAESVGGKLTVASAAGKGTQINIDFPVRVRPGL